MPPPEILKQIQHKQFQADYSTNKKLLSLKKAIKMDIQTRKIAFIQEFLKIQSDELLSQFEKLLKNNDDEKTFEPLTVEELNNRIATSEKDFKNGNYKTSSQLLEKYK